MSPTQRQTKNQARAALASAAAPKAAPAAVAGPSDEALRLSVDHAHEILRRLMYHRDGDFFINVNRRGAEAIHARTIATIVHAALVAAPTTQAAPAAVAHQGVVAWPVMPPSKGQSPVLFEGGYAEGWAKCLDACKAALATASTAQPTSPAVVEPLEPDMTDVVGVNERLHYRRGWRAAELAHGIGIKKGEGNA